MAERLHALVEEYALDDGSMWRVAYAPTEMTPVVEELIVALLRRAAD